jgi:hypothetical protein
VTDQDRTPAEQVPGDDHVTVTNIATNVDGNVVQAGVIHGGVTIR